MPNPTANSSQDIQNSVHLCIATGQNAANLIPLKQLQAQHVIILETPEMKKNRSAADLKLALKPYAKDIKVQAFDDTSPKKINASALGVAESLDGQDVIFHVTGGTKLMVLSLYDNLKLLASGKGTLRSVYTDTTNQMLDWLGTDVRQEPMKEHLTLKDLLLVRGYQMANDARPSKNRGKAEERAKLTTFMGNNAKSLGGFFSTLAYLANSCEHGRLQQSFDYPPGGPASDLLKMANEQGLLQWKRGQLEIEFSDMDSAKFFAGGWAEELVFLKMSMFKAEQYGTNIQIEQRHSQIRNEIDAMAVKNNRALVVECKSGRQVKAQESIYKLKQVVGQVGGLVAKGLYVSAQRVGQADRDRAKEYHIDVLAGEELKDLSDYIRAWAKI